MAGAKKTKIKVIVADNLMPAATPDGMSLEEQVNTFLATLANGDILDVQVVTEKAGKYGQNPVNTATVTYLG